MPETVHEPVDRCVADILAQRRDDILLAYEQALTGGTASPPRQDAGPAREAARAILVDAHQRVLHAGRRAGDGSAPDEGAAGSRSALGYAATRALFRTTIEVVADGLPPYADRPGALALLAAAVHESISDRADIAPGTRSGLLEMLYRAHLDERRRVARELHDVIAHSVAVVLQDLELFTLHRERDPQRAEVKLRSGLDNLRGTLDMVRAATRELRHAPTQDGLVAALRAYLESDAFGRRTQLRVTGDEAALPPVLHAELFLVLREAARNAHVHGAAEHVMVEVDITSVRVWAAVTDDGLGFDPTALPAGTGLASMRERVALLGGVLEVRSAPGAGTTVRVEVPLDGGPG